MMLKATRRLIWFPCIWHCVNNKPLDKFHTVRFVPVPTTVVMQTCKIHATSERCDSLPRALTNRRLDAAHKTITNTSRGFTLNGCDVPGQTKHECVNQLLMRLYNMNQKRVRASTGAYPWPGHVEEVRSVSLVQAERLWQERSLHVLGLFSIGLLTEKMVVTRLTQHWSTWGSSRGRDKTGISPACRPPQ